MPKTNTDFFIEFQKPLVLIVHPEIFTLDEAKKELQTKFNWPVLSIGKVLSRDMLSGQVSGAAAVQAWLIDQVRRHCSLVRFWFPILTYSLNRVSNLIH